MTSLRPGELVEQIEPSPLYDKATEIFQKSEIAADVTSFCEIKYGKN